MKMAGRKERGGLIRRCTRLGSDILGLHERGTVNLMNEAGQSVQESKRGSGKCGGNEAQATLGVRMLHFRTLAAATSD